MPAATNRNDLIDVTRKEWDKLVILLDRVEAAQAEGVVVEGWSPREIVIHRAHWIDLFLGWYRDGQAGREVHFPAPGYNWSELKRYNGDLLTREAGVDWPLARDRLSAAHGRLVAFYDGMDDAALYGGAMKGARNKWTTGRRSEAAGASHYRSAGKFVRKCLRAVEA